ncbi:MAG: hypothetical protein Kow0074_14400 [Candidatus Zixiibacteriota bacterium]
MPKTADEMTRESIGSSSVGHIRQLYRLPRHAAKIVRCHVRFNQFPEQTGEFDSWGTVGAREVGHT